MNPERVIGWVLAIIVVLALVWFLFRLAANV